MKPITGRFVFVVTTAFFGTIVAVNAVMMRIAISTMPGVTVESAYSGSLAYSREIANARRQEQRDWTVDAHVQRRQDGSATVQMNARDRRGQPVSKLAVQCRFERPADRRSDETLVLEETSGGAYQGRLTAIAAGQWDLVIESRLADEVVFMSRHRVVLDHG